MNSEKLRALLQQALDMLEEQSLRIEAPILPAGEKLLDRIRAALAEPVEPAPAQDELLIKLADFARFVIKCVRRNGEYAPASMQEPHEIETLLAAAFADRPRRPSRIRSNNNPSGSALRSGCPSYLKMFLRMQRV